MTGQVEVSVALQVGTSQVPAKHNTPEVQLSNCTHYAEGHLPPSVLLSSLTAHS